MNTANQSSSGDYFPSLDGIRGLAVLSVVIYHTAYFNPASPFQNLLYSFTKAGFMGVPIFFVLSGFLISHTIFKSSFCFNWRTYAIRRAAKIVAPFAISLVVFSLLALLWKNPSNIIASALAYCVTLPNFTTGWETINPVYWSLMVEIHFYILFPIIFLVLRRFTAAADILSCALLWFIPTVIRITTHLPISTEVDSWAHNANMFPKALDNFVLGIMFAIIIKNQSTLGSIIRKSGLLATAGLTLLFMTYGIYGALQMSKSSSETALVHSSVVYFELFRTLPALGTFLLLFCVFLPGSHPLTKFLCFKPISYLGLISYELFLFHQPPVQFLTHVLGDANGNVCIYLGRTLFPFTVSLIASAIVYHYVSAPILKLSKQSVRRKS